MNRDELAEEMRALGCTPESKADRYSTLLLRCGCGQHVLTAAAYRKDSAEPVKLFGAALSWYRSTGRKGPLTFVLGRDANGHWEQSLYAIQMIRPRGLEVDLQVDFEPATVRSAENLSAENLAPPDWVRQMMSAARPKVSASACRLAASAAKDNFAWYRSVTGQAWSGRLDGLEVCSLSGGDEGRLTFNVGKTGSQGANSRARTKFLSIAAANQDLFGAPNSNGYILLNPAGEARALAIVEALAASKIALEGSQEHRLESQVLRKAITLRTKEGPLEVVGEQHPFQFPTRWWPDGRPRYIDIIARQGPVPWVIELKVGQSQGEYYRDGLVQAALYREYILRSPALDEWFAEWELNRTACRAALVVPPLHGPDEALLREDHRGVAELLGVELIEEEAAGQ